MRDRRTVRVHSLSHPYYRNTSDRNVTQTAATTRACNTDLGHVDGHQSNGSNNSGQRSTNNHNENVDSTSDSFGGNNGWEGGGNDINDCYINGAGDGSINSDDVGNGCGDCSSDGGGSSDDDGSNDYSNDSDDGGGSNHGDDGGDDGSNDGDDSSNGGDYGSNDGDDGDGGSSDGDDGSNDGGSNDGDDDGGSNDGDDGSNNGGHDGSNDENGIESEMEKCILRIIHSKVKYGWSQEETLSQLQSLYELTQDEHIPHKTWHMVLKFLKKLGYKNPCHYKVCCGTDHVTRIIDGDKCPNCDKPKDKCVDYFVLGLNLESLFASEKKLRHHLAHWEERAEWFNNDNMDRT